MQDKIPIAVDPQAAQYCAVDATVVRDAREPIAAEELSP